LVLVLTLSGKDLDVDDSAIDSRRTGQGRILNIAGLFAKDRTKQLLFRGQLCLALWRDLTDQDGSGPDLRSDADDAAFVEVSKHVLADIRNIARDLFRTEFCVAGLDLELLDVDRRVVVVLDQTLGDKDCVLKVVSAPRHEGDKYVT